MSRRISARVIAVVVAGFLASSAGLAAEEGAAVKAVFGDVVGKVEYKLPNSAWKPAKAGDEIARGTIVSTGFKSSAVLKLGEASVFLKALTRLSLEDIAKTSGGTQTKLYLLAGRVKADVPKEAGKTNDFRVKSPTATASVRGTAFDFDGINLLVSRGRVQMATPTGQYRLVGAQEFAFLTPNGAVSPPESVAEGSDLAAVSGQPGASGFSPPPQPMKTKKSALTITLQ